MEQLTDTTKQEITKHIEIALKPISGKVKSFGEPFQMGRFSQSGNESRKTWDETLYPVLIDSSEGEFGMSLSSLHMPDPWDMVEVVIRDNFLGTRNKISSEKMQEIAEILYSEEFLALKVEK